MGFEISWVNMYSNVKILMYILYFFPIVLEALMENTNSDEENSTNPDVGPELEVKDDNAEGEGHLPFWIKSVVKVVFPSPKDYQGLI